MEPNGVNVLYQLDTNVFKIGEAFEFELGTNKYRNGILTKIDTKHNEMTFITVDGAVIVLMENGSFYIMEVYETDTTYKPAHFRKLKPSYDNKDMFNWD